MIVGAAPLLTLPAGGPLAAAGGRGAVWVAAGDPPELSRFDPGTGERTASQPLDAPAVAVGSSGRTVLVATAEQVRLHDADTLTRLGTAPLEAVRWLSAGGEAQVWAATPRGVVHRLVDGSVAGTVTVGPAAGLAADALGAWVAAADGPVLQRIGNDLHVTGHEPGIDPDGRGGITACGNACWVGGVDELMAVTDAGRLLGPFRAPAGSGTLTPLGCVGGAVLGGSDPSRMVVLDPAADAGMAVISIPADGPVEALVAARPFAWVVTGGRAVWLVER